MKFTFEALQDSRLMDGSAYFMTFGAMNSQQDAAIVEGKLLTAFGKPLFVRDSYEDSFEYIIRATSEDGDSVILTVYGMGMVHIGAQRQDDYAQRAAEALIEYVSTFAPTDFSRTLYYPDAELQIDIEVKDGVATVTQSPMARSKLKEFFKSFFGGF